MPRTRSANTEATATRVSLFAYRALPRALRRDPELVFVTTHLVGAKTRFLPFKQGRFGGAGNPPVPPTREGYATSYPGEETWARDSVLDLEASVNPAQSGWDGTSEIPINGFALGSLDDRNVELGLKVHPERGPSAKVAPKAHASLRRDCALATKDRSDSIGRHPDGEGQLVRGHAPRLQLGAQDTSGMRS